MRQICGRTEGLVLAVGPSGSGKTTTLYGCLAQIAGGGRSVLTIEDPVEARIEGVVQCAVRQEVDSTKSLAALLRSAVRQDADVLLVSEIRDAATAAAVLSSSMAGRLTFSSMHGASLGGVLSRLARLVPPREIASALSAVVETRLLRRGSAREGYRGRSAVAVVTTMDGGGGAAALDRLIAGGTATQIDAALVQAGGGRMIDAANDAAADAYGDTTDCTGAGWTDVAEVRRVLGVAG